MPLIIAVNYFIDRIKAYNKCIFLKNIFKNSMRLSYLFAEIILFIFLNCKLFKDVNSFNYKFVCNRILVESTIMEVLIIILVVN